MVLNFKSNVVSLLLITLLLFSCQKEEDQAYVLLSPFEIYLNSEPAQVIAVEVSCHTLAGIKQLLVTSRIVGSYSVTVLDTLVSGNDFNFTFEYLVPDMFESGTIFLEFTMIDVASKSTKNARIIEVEASKKYLVETAGHEMFSGNSGRQDGYNLLTGVPLFTSMADSSFIHIADTSNSDVLLRRWLSPAGNKFVKFSGFDYANCTDLSAQDAYNAGIKFDFVDNLAQGDILITRSKNSSGFTYIVIKVVNIIDNPGSTSDRYVFNIKR